MYKIDKIQKESQRIYIIGQVISLVLYSILIPIIIFNFTLIIKSFLFPNETPDFFGYKSFVIMSGSMKPTINTGDAILVKEISEDEIKINDIVSFWQDGTNVTHRIIEITEENGIKKYKTKGDNNQTADKESITYEQIEGRYQFRIPQFGRIIEILKSKITWIILVFIIIVIYVYKKRIEQKKRIRKEKREQYNR